MKTGVKRVLRIAAVSFAGYGLLPSGGCKRARRVARAHRACEEKRLYLTFDDGPDPRYTERLLDLLARYDVHASFFVVARQAQAQPELIRRMRREGHFVGLHSLEHRSSLMNAPGYEVKALAESTAIFARLGLEITAYRPPWGHSNLALLQQLRQRGIRLVLWDVMAEDWQACATAAGIAEKLLLRTRGGDIICLHDSHGAPGAPERTIQALEIVIPQLLARGYVFETVDGNE